MPDCNVPALFAGGVDDAFVGSHHAENLFNAHGGLRRVDCAPFPCLRSLVDRARWTCLDAGLPGTSVWYSGATTPRFLLACLVVRKQVPPVRAVSWRPQQHPREVVPRPGNGVPADWCAALTREGPACGVGTRVASQPDGHPPTRWPLSFRAHPHQPLCPVVCVCVCVTVVWLWATDLTQAAQCPTCLTTSGRPAR